ncbi:MAG: MBL fold metallo-hydrolase [Acidobacteriota bacterium]
MFIRQIRDPHLAHYSYLLGCSQTRQALVIDPGRDIDRYIHTAEAAGLEIVATAETHVHADYVSGARELAERYVSRLYLSGEGRPEEGYTWLQDGDYEAELVRDGATFRVGQVELQAMHTPGHSPEHLCFLVFDRSSGLTEPVAVASGDCVLIGDVGRPELLTSAESERQSATEDLYRSLQRFLELPEFLQLWPAHHHGCSETAISTVGYEKRTNRGLLAAQKSRETLNEIVRQEPVEPLAYFERLHQLNRQGPPLLGALPEPRALAAEELEALLHLPGAVVLEVSRSREEFMLGHFPGTLFTPLGESFPRLVGSMVQPDERIYLLADAGRVDEAVGDLVRIGLDRIAGYIAPETLCDYLESDGTRLRSKVIRFTPAGAKKPLQDAGAPIFRRALSGQHVSS